MARFSVPFIFLYVFAALTLSLLLMAPQALAQENRACGTGYEKDGALCYPVCKLGYNGVGPVCWQRCDDGFKNDGAFCRQDVKILARDSYGRGAGNPMGCSASEEKDGALCYSDCKPNYNGVGPVCWKMCPDGYKNDGATCRKDAKIIKANTSKCPWYDKCGLAAKKGCSKCPAGYKNDGCTCRRNAHIFGKDSYGRGAGSPLHACKSGEEKSGALCYPACKSGYKAVGPVCWANCPSGFKSDGATCRKDAKIIAKKSYGRGAGKMLRRDYHGLFERYIRDHHTMYYFRGSAFTAEENAYLRQWFPAHMVDKVRVVEELRSTGAFNHKADATTYGDDLIVINKKRAGRRSLDLLKHEMVHICQYDVLGSAGFARRYANQWIDNGYSYDNIPFEVDAFDFQALADASTPLIRAYNGSNPDIYRHCR